jgi:hypothetical protein
VDTRAGLDDMEKRKFLPHRDSNSNPSTVQFVFSLLFHLSVVAVAFGLCTMVGRNGEKGTEEKLRLANSVWDAVERGGGGGWWQICSGVKKLS